MNLFSRGKKNIVLPHENKIHVFAPPCSILYIFAGCGNVFMIRKVEYDQHQVSESLEAYDGWAWDVCDIAGCSSDFPFVGRRYSNGTAVLDL